MKKSTLVMACIAAVVAGCASRPAAGPGSGYGATYEPMVGAHTKTPVAYDTDVADCQKTARGYTFVRPDDHTEALFILDTVVLGSIAHVLTGPARLLAAEGVAGGYLYGFDYWVHSPYRAAFYQRQETAIANCMARKGYSNADDSVMVTWKPSPTFITEQLRRTGVDTYNAEQYAKARMCTAMPFARLTAKGPGFESYTMRCDGGRQLAVRCEWGNCRAV